MGWGAAAPGHGDADSAAASFLAPRLPQPASAPAVTASSRSAMPVLSVLAVMATCPAGSVMGA